MSAAECPHCLAALEPGAECGLCADPGAAHEPVVEPGGDGEFVPDADPRRWGFLDADGVFVPVPKTPLLLAGATPPVTLPLFFGERTIIAEPESAA